MRVKISPTIANEYLSRDVRAHEEMRNFPITAGWHDLDKATIAEMEADAKHFVYDTDATPAAIMRSYFGLLAQLSAIQAGI